MARNPSEPRCSSSGLRPRWIVIAAFVSVALGGCVQRRMMIRSNPPGALVYVDDYEIGTTPVSHNFTYYGTREIRLVKDGYETLTVKQPIPAPWFQVPPLDFVTDNLLPAEIRDERAVTYNLSPQVIVPTDSLMARADSLRQDANLQASFIQAPPVLSGASSTPTGPETLPPGGIFPAPQVPGEGPLLGPDLGWPQTLPSEGIPAPAGELWPLPGGLAPQSLAPGGAPPRYAP